MKQLLELIKYWAKAVGQWLKQRPLWMKYTALVLLIFSVVVLVIWRWGFRQQIDTGLIAKDPARVDNLWFLPDGTLVGTLVGTIEHSDEVVSLWNEKSGGLVSERRTFDYFQIYDFLEDIQRTKFYAEKDARRALPSLEALTRDGQKFVVYHDGLLADFEPNLKFSAANESGFIGSWRAPLSIYRDRVEGKRVAITDLGPNKSDSPAALTITDNGLIALAYPDGRVEFRSFEDISSVIGARKTTLTKPTLMKPLGNFLAVVSIPNATLVLLDVNSVRDTPSHGYPPAAEFKLAISDAGRLAVNNGSNTVYLSKADGSGDANIPVKAFGIVSTLSFFDENRIIVGGKFQDVYLLAENQLPYKIAVAPKQVNALAVTSNRLAFAGEDGLTLLWHTNRRVLNRLGWATLILFGLFLVGTLAFYQYDYRKRRETAIIPPVEIPTDDESRRPSLPDVPPALVKAFQAGECVLYCGSGVSAQAGFPYWQPFVEDLTEWVIRNGYVDIGFGSSLRAALAQGNYDSVSDNLVSIMQERQSQLNEYLSNIFLKKAALPNSVNLLKSLPFSAVMTTNFDNLLEQAFADKATAAFTPSDAELLLQSLHNREFFLLKLYGKLERPSTVTLAPSQYDDVVKGNLLFSQFMETLLISRTVFFVGSGLEGIQAYLKGMPLPRQSLRTHYALVAVSGEAWQAKAQPLKDRYGIAVLPYSPSAGHPELELFLKKLHDRVQEEAEGTTADVEPVTQLKKISLTHVGPFETLELNLDRHWNILLGDNGVGKSSIIKAIAVAILGDDAKAYAHRIIKSGKPSSVITLETGRNTYTTKLFRKNGEARVESIPGRPFEAEGWLAVGFPPLRTVSWVRPQAAEQETKGRPTPDDLLPVIVGEADPRLDKLKQWIVNVDYWIKDARSRKGNPEQYERLLNEFFDVVGQLTTGTRIQFKEVNAQTKEITIITDDGELPIEALSQGMTSLIGWVGILLQRLYEVYGRDQDPKQRYALVLMDEIDAHLHPAWQQSLIRKLGKIFPNVQFIATTHSPLIVGGMKPEQIIRFARDEDQKVITYRVDEEMTIGRADQILASDLFGLETTFTLNDDLDALMKEYHELLAKKRSENEEIRFQQLRDNLKTRIPLVGETPAEQKAMGLIQALLQSDSDGKYESVNQELLKRAEQLLDEVGKKRK